MTTFGGSTVPPLFVNTFGGGGLEFTIDNSAVQGILAFGGWIFPIDGVADRGHIKVGIRDGSGDSSPLDDEYAAVIDPPDYVMDVTGQTGTDFDFGSSGFSNTSTACINIANGGRWVSNAGVARTVQRTQTINIRNAPAPNTCPGTTIFFTKEYNITAIFTG